MSYFIAGARLSGDNVTGDCPHRHRTAEAAQACIDRTDRAIKRGHGRYAYCDRWVIEIDETGARRLRLPTNEESA